MYTSESDLLNVALIGITAKEWREANPDKTDNIQDYADFSQLVCLSNLVTLNTNFHSTWIKQTGFFFMHHR